APQPAGPRPLPTIEGSYYRVQRGETLWRIGHDFGLTPHAIARANKLPGTASVSVGQVLYLPAPQNTSRFLWPARGHVQTMRGAPGSANITLQIAVPEASAARASRSGRVAVAAQQLSGWGRTVVLDHGDGMLSLYGGLEQILVNPGATVRQGNAVGMVGRSPLYFEIRQGVHPRDPMKLLP
ncbi:MAG: peptidoglycan DD-metalloendopeptidase family protein, partial [Candidatus Omnitrophica bacterium]|nr:peptidoglycan DD-metalloendopeptidase family protein [Candidatus Omnitrophota bacterium]